MRLRGSLGEVSLWRAGAERGLRLTVLGLLAWYLMHIIRDRRDMGAEVSTSAELTARLTRWSTVTSPTLGSM